MSNEAAKPGINKMHEAIKIMRQLKTQAGIDMAESRNREVNAQFRRIATERLQLTVSGVNTYTRNVNLFLAGKDPYATNKRANAKRRALLTAPQPETEVKMVDTTIGTLEIAPQVNEEHRWWIIDEAHNKVVDSYPTVELCKQAAATFQALWRDKLEILVQSAK